MCLCFLTRVVVRCTQGADLVELTSTLPSALYALQSVFFEPSLPHDIHIAAANTLMQLTLPDTYFTSGEVRRVVMRFAVVQVPDATLIGGSVRISRTWNA